MQSTADTGEPQRLAENGAYFCKRDRNKAGTIGIYTCKGRQTIRVASADTRDPQEAELALARYVLTNVEAMVREGKGITKVDLHLKECLNIYAIAREAFHNEVVKKVQGLCDKAEAEGEHADKISTLRFQIKRAKDAARKERANLALVLKNLERVWPDGDKKVSEMDQVQQRHAVKVLRAVGYADSTIDLFSRITRGSMHYCQSEGRLLLPVPAALSKKEWMIKSDEDDDDIVAYTIDEMVALFEAAAQQETWWRFMNLSTHAARVMTIIEAPWSNVTVGANELHRWKLNPPGKRRTSKRRPRIAMCATLAAEMRTWKRDAARIVSDGRGHPIEGAQMFDGIKRAAGLRRGSAKSIRKFIRTWLAVNGVPETMADWFMGHADEGSETGQDHYKDKQPGYMGAVVAALEKLYEVLRERVTKRRIAGGLDIMEDQPTVEDLLRSLRVTGVTKMIATGSF